MEIVFEWDARKAHVNLEKHKIDFDEAQTVFNDPLLVTFSDEEHSITEDRFISIGLSERNRVLLVIHTEREELVDKIVIRIISCRKATLTERNIYEKDR